MEFIIKEITSEYRAEVDTILQHEWSAPPIVSRGKTIDTRTTPGFVALVGDKVCGVVTYQIVDNECEIASLNSLIENIGIGTALINAVRAVAEERGCTRVWLITSNDDIEAIRFYQKKGMELAAVYLDAMDLSRQIKPAIPLIGMHGIPIKHEFEFEFKLIAD